MDEEGPEDLQLGRLFDDAQAVERVQREGRDHPRRDRVGRLFDEARRAVAPEGPATKSGAASVGLRFSFVFRCFLVWFGLLRFVPGTKRLAHIPHEN